MITRKLSKVKKMALKGINKIAPNRIPYNIVDKQGEKVNELLENLDGKYGKAPAIKWIEKYLQDFTRSRTKEVTKKRIYHILKSWE